MNSPVYRLLIAALSCVGLVQSALSQSKLPEPPGRLIEVNGHRLHLNCRGEGAPIVVYEAGASGSSLDWEKVQPVVAATTRSCGYDRAGYGWSEPSGAAKTTSQDIAQELHELLRKAGEGAPYLLVGHSLGGFHVQLFAHLYPNEVVGVVLVDSSHEDQFDWYQTYIAAVPSTAASAPDPEPNRTAATAEIVRVMREDPKFAATQSREGSGILDSVALLREFDSLPNIIPLIVLTRGAEKQLEGDWTAFDLMWNRGQRNLASLSPRSTQIHVPGASHFIQLDRPDVVVASILRIVAIARESALAGSR
jgi:pimeloyl-ACP methyl ester carboxylesterase